MLLCSCLLGKLKQQAAAQVWIPVVLDQYSFYATCAFANNKQHGERMEALGASYSSLILRRSYSSLAALTYTCRVKSLKELIPVVGQWSRALSHP